MNTFPILLIALCTATCYIGMMLYQSSLIFSGQQRGIQMSYFDEKGNNCSTTSATVKSDASASSSSSSSISQQNLLFEDPCEAEMQEIFQRNDCLRSHSRNNNYCSDAAEAVHVHGVYDGQGFGRILQHTMDTCLFAAALRRPCIIDFDVRDKYYTWRSFLNTGEYNWALTTRLDRNEAFQNESRDAYNKLPNKGSNEWKDDTNFPKYETVLPLQYRKDQTAQELYAYWTADNPDTRHLRLLSPSFGFGWWYHGFSPDGIQRYFPPRRISTKNNGLRNEVCPVSRLRTMLQNAMYAPTTLAKELFQERLVRLWASHKIVQQPTPSTSTKEEDRKLQYKPPTPKKYGAIHLRTTLSSLKRTFYDNEETVEILRQCLNGTHTSDIDTWWLVSDNVTNAEYVETRIDKVITDYDEMAKRKARHLADRRQQQNEINYHSGYQMKEKFGHELFAPSMEDYMVLHESTVAIVTHGAFGDTGARGNGKIKLEDCGPKNIFKVYRRQ